MVEQPTELTQAAALCANLMEEIKRRVEVIRFVTDGQTKLAPMPAFELCYLQLRKVCEVFALACLCVHGDIPEVRTKFIQKAYSADEIMKALTDLHPDFYPTPTNQVLDPATGQVVSTEIVPSGFLTKEDLLSLYGECGNYLHRGNIRQLLTREPEVDFSKIAGWASKIIKFLNHHQIRLRQPDKQLWVLMHGKDDGKVHYAIMQRVSDDQT